MEAPRSLHNVTASHSSCLLNSGRGGELRLFGPVYSGAVGGCVWVSGVWCLVFGVCGVTECCRYGQRKKGGNVDG